MEQLLRQDGEIRISGAPEGLDAALLVDLASTASAASSASTGDAPLLSTPLLSAPLLFTHVARDEARMNALAEQIRFFAPHMEVLCFPAWDCLPYDRVSPRADVMMRRLECLFRLQEEAVAGGQARILLTTVNAVVQRVAAPAQVARFARRLRRGDEIGLDALALLCAESGYARVDVVAEPGEFARRGGLLDVYPAGRETPARLDFFGERLESIRGFDAASQRSGAEEEEILLFPASEVFLGEESVARFRAGYVARFGAASGDDDLYQSISQGKGFAGMEHWLPLFHKELATLFDYLPEGGWMSFDDLAVGERARRMEAIAEYQGERARHAGETAFGAPIYQPLAVEELYLGEAEWRDCLAGRRARYFVSGSGAMMGDVAGAAPLVLDAGGRRGRDFAPERMREGGNVFAALAEHIKELRGRGLRVVLASWSAASRERMSALLEDHGVSGIVAAETWAQAAALPSKSVASVSLSLEAGVESGEFALISEQDVLGERVIRRQRKRKRIFFDIGDLTPGDYVVHVDHGIARFEGLERLEAAGAFHDCLLLAYRGGDKLFLPVENADLLSRYASSEGEVALDRLGSAAWQARKAGVRKRLRDMAGRLIATAKARVLSAGALFPPPPGYEEFCARFPFEETEDQADAVEMVAKDMVAGRPMDRLVCGDVGFGKTEVALRAAFLAAMNGRQVAVLTPTTLLARQHYATFCSRFFGFPVEIRQLSRFIPPKETRETIEGLAAGKVDIVIGTHALLAKRVRFHGLGLFILDEEQHFGVRHKERLKELQHGVHVLTLSATPIPRTLQLALSGVRELSVVATPPADRIAVRSYLTPFDPVVTREALLRERYRGGRSFYVCPRIADLDEVAAFLRVYVPELKVAVAHGRMPVARLDASMTAFYEGACDILLTTNIVESGLDIPEANTLVVHRADLFGLAQLYQLRGRIGRGKIRAYAYFTVPAKRALSQSVERRLHVLLSMEELGSGFQLAFHDLELRGAGNLLGEEQSGHIREVGLELYRSMLEEAVRESRGEAVEEAWSPRINLGASALLPEEFVSDSSLRMSLYRRLGRLREVEEVAEFAAELADRFGPPPPEAERLLAVVRVKILCRRAGVERMEAGEGGVVVKFRRDWFADPGALARWIEERKGAAWLRPDHHLVWQGAWPEGEGERLEVCLRFAAQLAAMTEAAPREGDVQAGDGKGG